MIRLIASDLDGTLVSGNMASLPEGFPKIIGQLKERGIIFAYICENGALTIYQGEVLHKVVIPPETAVPIIRRLEEEPGTEVLVSGAFTSYIRPKEPLFEEYIKGMKNRYKVVPDLTDIGEPVIKLALFEKEGTPSGIIITISKCSTKAVSASPWKTHAPASLNCVITPHPL